MKAGIDDVLKGIDGVEREEEQEKFRCDWCGDDVKGEPDRVEESGNSYCESCVTNNQVCDSCENLVAEVNDDGRCEGCAGVDCAWCMTTRNEDDMMPHSGNFFCDYDCMGRWHERHC